MTLFPQERPVANIDLEKLWAGNNIDGYIKKLEETVNYLSGKIK